MNIIEFKPRTDPRSRTEVLSLYRVAIANEEFTYSGEVWASNQVTAVAAIISSIWPQQKDWRMITEHSSIFRVYVEDQYVCHAEVEWRDSVYVESF